MSEYVTEYKFRCPQCGEIETVYHLDWYTAVCNHCKKEYKPPQKHRLISEEKKLIGELIEEEKLISKKKKPISEPISEEKTNG